MSNPLRILTLLDKNLASPAEITLFGRSAIALGFPNSPPQFHSTQDVDGILPMPWLQSSDTHDDFWHAVEKTNDELQADGLYLTHLFREIDIIIQPDWMKRRIELNLRLTKLMIFRPGTIDLVLTKMARADHDDLEDIRFLIQQAKLTAAELNDAFEHARLPGVTEIKELFDRARPKVLAMAR